MAKTYTNPPLADVPITEIQISRTDVNEAYLLKVILAFERDGAPDTIVVATLIAVSLSVTDCVS